MAEPSTPHPVHLLRRDVAHDALLKVAHRLVASPRDGNAQSHDLRVLLRVERTLRGIRVALRIHADAIVLTGDADAGGRSPSTSTAASPPKIELTPSSPRAENESRRLNEVAVLRGYARSVPLFTSKNVSFR